MERQHYLWTADASTLNVNLAADVITRIRAAIESAERQSEEVGGILLGRQSDNRILIEDFELIPSEHRRGMTFTLSGHDRRRLAARLSASRRGRQVLGSFRTHLRQGLYMDQYDFELMSAHFPGSTDVMLLIRPNDWKAGFFVWEEGEISRQKTHHEFSFDPAALPLIATEPISVAGKARANKSAFTPASSRRLPTLMKVGLMAATAGLVGVLAFFSHEHRVPNPVTTSLPATHMASIATEQPRMPVASPPVDPDIAQDAAQPQTENQPDDQFELHVKVPPRPSPFAKSPPPLRTATVTARALRVASLPQPATPPAPIQPLQTAVNIPPPIVQTVLRPVRPTFVSEVSLEPAQPGVIKRGLHHVPVLNLFARHNYKSGHDFAPARPLREVKPRIPDNLDQEAAHPVDVKVWIDETGQVTKAELLSDHVDTDIAGIASNAAYKWTFEPARLSDHPVPSEMVMHFHFVPKQSY